jgi:hypothetical protein
VFIGSPTETTTNPSGFTFRGLPPEFIYSNNMQVVLEAINTCTPICKENFKKWQSIESLKLCEDINNMILKNVDSKKNHDYICKYITQICGMFIWTSRCCHEPSVVADTYNIMHMAGILFFKCVYIIIKNETPLVDTSSLTIMFPKFKAIQVSDVPFVNMTYKELIRAITALQHEWHVLTGNNADECTVNNAISAIVKCIARFGCMLLYQLPIEILDELEQRENIIGSSSKAFRPSNRCIRNITTTCMVMIRQYIFNYTKKSVYLEVIDVPITGGVDSKLTELIENKIPLQTVNPYGLITDIILQNIKKIKLSRENISAVGQNINIPLSINDEMWKYISNHIGPTQVGEKPRKFPKNLELLLRDICMCLAFTERAQASGIENGRCIVSSACVRVLECALRHFYIIPSATLFQRIVLIEQILPGQRLNYTFDYQFFDSGQLSQVVYMYNPIHKTGPSPINTTDWSLSSVAGPISALCQLLPELEVYLIDSEDPLGFHRHKSQIIRPADYFDTSKNQKKMQNQIQCRLVVTNSGAYLVDINTNEIFTTDMPHPQKNIKQPHYVLNLLAFLVQTLGFTKKIAAIALNSTKLSLESRSL